MYNKKYNVVIEDIIENIFITLALAFFIENKKPTVKKVLIITIVTLFYWIIVLNYLRPLYS